MDKLAKTIKTSDPFVALIKALLKNGVGTMRELVIIMVISENRGITKPDVAEYLDLKRGNTSVRLSLKNLVNSGWCYKTGEKYFVSPLGADLCEHVKCKVDDLKKVKLGSSYTLKAMMVAYAIDKLYLENNGNHITARDLNRYLGNNGNNIHVFLRDFYELGIVLRTRVNGKSKYGHYLYKPDYEAKPLVEFAHTLIGQGVLV